jgi:ribosomal-protein-alanine N-acetyltransferase
LTSVQIGDTRVTVRPIASESEARRCASIMAGSDPWRTLGRGFDASLAILMDSAREVYVAIAGDERNAAGSTADGDIVGFLILNMRGAFVGYIQTVAVREDWRGRGLGTMLIAFAEARILRETPNVFLCVSSFNHRAKALYERLGYEVVGELRDYVVRGHSEWLLRKSVGPLMDSVAHKP